MKCEAMENECVLKRTFPLVFIDFRAKMCEHIREGNLYFQIPVGY